MPDKHCETPRLPNEDPSIADMPICGNTHIAAMVLKTCIVIFFMIRNMLYIIHSTWEYKPGKLTFISLQAYFYCTLMSITLLVALAFGMVRYNTPSLTSALIFSKSRFSGNAILLLWLP